MSDSITELHNTQKPKKSLYDRFTRALSIALVIVLLFCAAHGFYIFRNIQHLPEVYVTHGDDYSLVLFADTRKVIATTNYYGKYCAILPLSDGNFLVGMVLAGHQEGSLLFGQHFEFTLFDSNWDYISSIPFDAEDFRSTAEASRLYGDAWTEDIDDNENASVRVQYSFESNSIRYVETDYTKDDGNTRLESLVTDVGIIKQTISSYYRPSNSVCLYKCYYYDFETSSVKVMSLPELDGALSENGNIKCVTEGDVSLIYGSTRVSRLPIGPPGRTSFAFMLKNQAVVFSESYFFSEEETQASGDSWSIYNIAPQIWINSDGFTLAWPLLSAIGNYRIQNISSDGLSETFTSVSLSDEIDHDKLLTCYFDAQSKTLELPVSDELWIEIDNTGGYIEIDPGDNNAPGQQNEYQFFYGNVYIMDQYEEAAAIYRQRYSSLKDQLFVKSISWNNSTNDSKAVFLKVVYNPTTTRYF